MTVMVVDDTSILRRVLSDILVEFCDVPRQNIYEAVDGMEALSEYKRVRPDMVFLDIAMPKLSGLDVVKQILQIDPSANIIMCTAAGHRDVVKECVYAGAKDYLVKPLQPERVVDSVRKIMGTVPRSNSLGLDQPDQSD